MKPILYLSVAALLLAGTALAQTPSSTNLGRNPYPQIGKDGRVTFRVNAPEAGSLTVNLGKDYPMTKDEKGVWQKVETYEYDDPLPYGHGEKSVYIINGFMRLTREEAFAIRYHMGYSSEKDDTRNISAAFEMFPLAFALSVADSEATYYLEGKNAKK